MRVKHFLEAKCTFWSKTNFASGKRLLLATTLTKSSLWWNCLHEYLLVSSFWQQSSTTWTIDAQVFHRLQERDDDRNDPALPCKESLFQKQSPADMSSPDLVAVTFADSGLHSSPVLLAVTPSQSQSVWRFEVLSLRERFHVKAAKTSFFPCCSLRYNRLYDKWTFITKSVHWVRAFAGLKFYDFCNGGMMRKTSPTTRRRGRRKHFSPQTTVCRMMMKGQDPASPSHGSSRPTFSAFFFFFFLFFLFSSGKRKRNKKTSWFTHYTACFFE